MSELLEAIQRRHQEALDQLQQDEVDESFLESIHVLLDDLRQAGALVPDPGERGQLRALMRFWANVIYDRTGAYPDTTLQPLDPARARPLAEPAPRPRERKTPFDWLLVGSVGLILLLSVALGVLWLSRDGVSHVSATPTPTPPPLPVSELVIGEAPVETGDVVRTRDVFCYGVPEIVSVLNLEDTRPETRWRWEVRRGDEVVNAQPEQRWKGDLDVPLTVLSGDDGGVEPGRYEFRVYVDDQLVEARVFRVLETAPRITDLRVADVPEPSDADPGDQFGAGTRVIYLTYRYEGFCPSLEISHRLYHQGDVLREKVKAWDGPPQGERQVIFQALDEEPFPSGDYAAVVELAGRAQIEEQTQKASFTIGEPEPEITPSFGDVTIALGVGPDGTPILPVEETSFDWNTKVVYAIFEYAGMRDGLSWSAVWARNGQEVARQEGLWDAEAFGAQGTRWVAYYDEQGWTLPGGDYAVTLLIDGEAQRRREFNIRYYVTNP